MLDKAALVRRSVCVAFIVAVGCTNRGALPKEDDNHKVEFHSPTYIKEIEKLVLSGIVFVGKDDKVEEVTGVAESPKKKLEGVADLVPNKVNPSIVHFYVHLVPVQQSDPVYQVQVAVKVRSSDGKTQILKAEPQTFDPKNPPKPLTTSGPPTPVLTK